MPPLPFFPPLRTCMSASSPSTPEGVKVSLSRQASQQTNIFFFNFGVLPSPRPTMKQPKTCKMWSKIWFLWVFLTSPGPTQEVHIVNASVQTLYLPVPGPPHAIPRRRGRSSGDPWRSGHPPGWERRFNLSSDTRHMAGLSGYTSKNLT